MTQPLSFQQVILKLHQFWSDQGCVIWEPYNVQVGAGTGNPATLLRVLGPEPWRVAYVEPSVRPDDGRFGENPNRMQKFYQYQVILKPDPGNPQELYLQSLEALGINPREHDIRFVEDNWESPALGAWGLGWEVWLDGQEITQYTYFQQAGGLELDPVSVEITYGVERIVLALQGKESVWKIDWMDGGLSYGDLILQDEIEHCRYYFDVADVDALKGVFDAYEQEYGNALEGDALIPAYDYVLKCSHLFNVLDTRGAIGVTERASYFRRMRDMTRTIARAYAEQREELGHPLLRFNEKWGATIIQASSSSKVAPSKPAEFLLEIGVEELPAGDVDDALAQLRDTADTLFENLRLDYQNVDVYATPRRLVLHAKDVAAKQRDQEFVAKGPPADRAFKDGKPTPAAEGFARGKGVNVEDLRVEEVDGGQYVMATVKQEGRPAFEVLQEVLPDVIAGIKFGKSMRWNASGVAFSRPIRWIVALLGEATIPFEYAGVASGNVSRGLRPFGSRSITIDSAPDYFKALNKQNILLDYDERRTAIETQIKSLADEVNGTIPSDPELLDEVTNLIESPTALRGTFETQYLDLPREVLITVMKNHQRYFPVEDADGKLLPFFIAVRNGDSQHLDKVIQGNEAVLRARFSDANFFYKEDIKKPLSDYLGRLATLTFQEHLGSMLDKNQRVARLVAGLGKLMGVSATDIAIAEQAAHLAKADLGTNMVVEMTSLQGVMGREYALREGIPQEVADAIFEHWLPRNAGDILPSSASGMLLGITDRLDSLVGLFAAGLAPKSTADPYGLRRAALGVIEIMAEKQIDANLMKAVNLVAAAQPIPVSDAAKTQVSDFVAGRLRVWLQEQDWASDIISAVLVEQNANPYRALVAVNELDGWVENPNWEYVLDNFARCVRITRAEPQTFSVNPDLLSEPQEQKLYKAYQEALETIDSDGNVGAFLSVFEPIAPTIAEFFDKVLVNAEDTAVRQNRLGLLQAISAMQNGRADLSELAGF